MGVKFVRPHSMSDEKMQDAIRAVEQNHPGATNRITAGQLGLPSNRIPTIANPFPSNRER